MCDGCVGAAALGIASKRSEHALGKLSAYNFGNHEFLFSACCAAAPEAEGTCNGEFSLVYFSCGGTDHGYARLRGTHGQNVREKLLVKAAIFLGNQDGAMHLGMQAIPRSQGSAVCSPLRVQFSGFMGLQKKANRYFEPFF